ncbi:universal stress protein [Haloarculaceae archaeon H-GB2-1]|nr:universal stress protein [Haloarculaceae archaeon H-GB11]MEA5407295.1 universal stress protein [Haloarculaceae archaeon H-GB2-1]
MYVLVGVDGTDASLTALEQALERAREAGDDLTVAVLVDADAAGDSLASTVRSTVDDSSVDASVTDVNGTPASSLVELADREGYDRLVIAGGDAARSARSIWTRSPSSSC